MTIDIDRDETESLKLALGALLIEKRVVERFGGHVTVKHEQAIHDMRNIIYRAEKPLTSRWQSLALGAGIRSW